MIYNYLKISIYSPIKIKLRLFQVNKVWKILFKKKYGKLNQITRSTLIFTVQSFMYDHFEIGMLAILLMENVFYHLFLLII